MDFTDADHPKEIAYFDRGFDVLELQPSEQLSANEIAAAIKQLAAVK